MSLIFEKRKVIVNNFTVAKTHVALTMSRKPSTVNCLKVLISQMDISQ